MNTKEKIEVMQAWEDDNILIEISDKGKNSWRTYSSREPNWEWYSFDYRVKKIPKELWINIYKEGVGGNFRAEEEAKLYGQQQKDYLCTAKFVEVLD